MAASQFTLYSNQAANMSAVTGNGKFTVLQSNPIANIGAMPAMTMRIAFKDITPDPLTTSPGWSIDAVLEGRAIGSSDWYEVAWLWDPLRRPTQGLVHIMHLSPNLSISFEGAPLDRFDGQGIASRLHRHQESLPEEYRLSITVIETKYGTSDALSGFKVDVWGERKSA